MSALTPDLPELVAAAAPLPWRLDAEPAQILAADGSGVAHASWEATRDGSEPNLRLAVAAVNAVGSGVCVHVPPSPGQSMCQCGHQQIELEFARDAAVRAAIEGEQTDPAAPTCPSCGCWERAMTRVVVPPRSTPTASPVTSREPRRSRHRPHRRGRPGGLAVPHRHPPAPAPTPHQAGVVGMMPDLRLQDERANREGVCGHIVRSGRYEWICIRPAHASTDRPWVTGRHFMVNRWPNRPAAAPVTR